MEPNPYEAPKEEGYIRPAKITGEKFSLLPYLALVAVLGVVWVTAGVMWVFLRSR